MEPRAVAWERGPRASIIARKLGRPGRYPFPSSPTYVRGAPAAARLIIVANHDVWSTALTAPGAFGGEVPPVQLLTVTLVAAGQPPDRG
jgi:hypothetical protein